MNEIIHSEEKIILFIDGELNKIQQIELKEHLKHCSKCKNIYKQYLLINKDISNFYKTITPEPIRHNSKSIAKIKYVYAIIVAVFLFTTVVFLLVNDLPKEKNNVESLIQEDQIDLHINEIAREIDYLDNQLNQETL